MTVAEDLMGSTNFFATCRRKFGKNQTLKSIENNRNVKYLGIRKGLEFFGYVDSSDLVICLTPHDALPRALREALYLSVPIIVTEETHYGNRVKEFSAGHVVLRNPASIREVIDDYIAKDDTQVREMRKNASRLSVEVYSWKRIAKKYVEIVRS